MHECIINQGIFIACESLYVTASLYSDIHRSQPDMGQKQNVKQQPEREREREGTDKKITGRINQNCEEKK